MRCAARTDRNHAAIRAALRRIGASVCDASRLGDGAPDLLVSFRGRISFLEVKSPRGRLTAAQILFHAQHPVSIVHSIDDALEAIGALAKPRR